MPVKESDYWSPSKEIIDEVAAVTREQLVGIAAKQMEQVPDDDANTKGIILGRLMAIDKEIYKFVGAGTKKLVAELEAEQRKAVEEIHSLQAQFDTLEQRGKSLYAKAKAASENQGHAANSVSQITGQKPGRLSLPSVVEDWQQRLNTAKQRSESLLAELNESTNAYNLNQSELAGIQQKLNAALANERALFDKLQTLTNAPEHRKATLKNELLLLEFRKQALQHELNALSQPVFTGGLAG